MLICGKVTNIIQLNKPHYKSFIVQQKKNPATCIQHQRQHTSICANIKAAYCMKHSIMNKRMKGSVSFPSFVYYQFHKLPH